MSEIQVFVGTNLISEGKPVRTSGSYPNSNPATVGDGKMNAEHFGQGYWILPNRTPGWIDVYISGQPPKE